MTSFRRCQNATCNFMWTTMTTIGRYIKTFVTDESEITTICFLCQCHQFHLNFAAVAAAIIFTATATRLKVFTFTHKKKITRTQSLCIAQTNKKKNEQKSRKWTTSLWITNKIYSQSKNQKLRILESFGIARAFTLANSLWQMYNFYQTLCDGWRRQLNMVFEGYTETNV